MRSIIILAVFGLLLIRPGASRAETTAECHTGCSIEMSSGITNCPPPTDAARAQCLQDVQDSYRHCVESCPQTAPADTPKDSPAETPPADTPKDN